jgi:hypothetical protein
VAKQSAKAIDKVKIPVENYFLRYAFPCTYVIKQRGEIDDKIFKKLENATFKNFKIERKLIESTYKKAFERMDRVAKEMKINDHWDIRVIKEYFTKKHNEMIEAGDGSYAVAPKVFKELCKVKKAKIIDAKEGFFIVKYDKNKTRVVASFFVPNAKIGECVMIHHGFAVEMVK